MEHRSLRLRPILRAVASRIAFAACLLGGLVSCASPVPAPTESGQTPAAATPVEASLPPTAVPARHAAELRFALVGAPRQVNAWALFDPNGAGYANAALRSGETPSLYHLSVPAREFEPWTAEGMPSAVTQEGSFYTAIVKLKQGLYWSDGSPLTAADVSFSAETALAFRLGLDWAAAYDPELLDHVEAVDAAAVKFFFKKAFTVGDWQYGALQGPILSEVYWSPKLAEAQSLLPAADLAASVKKTRAEGSALQARVDEDNALLPAVAPNSQNYKDISARLNRNQNELNSLNARTAKLQDEYDAAMNAARAALFALSDEAEPVFGPFLRAARSGDGFTRAANPSYPFIKPNYDRLAYTVFPDQASAVTALENNRVDAILDPQGLSSGFIFGRLDKDPDIKLAYSPIRSARFIVINPLNPTLTDPALRQALSCAVDRGTLARALSAAPLDSFILPGFGGWDNPPASPSCAYASGGSSAVSLLKAAGYRWSREPSINEPGEGLTLPDGSPFPSLRLLAPSKEVDPQRAEAAHIVELYFEQLGIPVEVRSAAAEDIRYAVFSTGDYDLALLGWRLGDYPGYLCDWFQPPGQFAFQDAALAGACDSLRSTADLTTAQQAAREVQAALMQSLPLLPLYQETAYEGWRNLSYPFETMAGGLSELYGAPELAIPIR